MADNVYKLTEIVGTSTQSDFDLPQIDTALSPRYTFNAVAGPV